MDLENQYYNSKALKEDDPAAALKGFEKVLALEENQGEWGFKALKQMMKLHFKMVGTRFFCFYEGTHTFSHSVECTP